MPKLTLLIAFTLAFAGQAVFAQDQQPADTMYQHLESWISKAENDLVFWKKLKINGWIQAQYQKIDTMGAQSVGGGNFPAYSDNRFILRRGRIKFTYDHSFAQYVLQIDV